MIEIIIVILLSLILPLLVVLLVLSIKKTKPAITNKNDNLLLYVNEQYSNLKLDLIKLISESSKDEQLNLNTFKEDITGKIDQQLVNVNEQVAKRLGEGFKGNQDTFTKVIERLVKIDEAQKRIEKLSDEVLSLNQILTDKSSRGIFGEIQMYQILEAVFGNNDELYEKQKRLSNGTIADSIIYAPKPLGSIAVDSKFPLNIYENMMEANLSKTDKDVRTREFKGGIKKHINAISEKYIIKDETSEYAMMFIPAEAIFAELTANHNDLIHYGHEKKIWIVSPTTLIATLTIIQTILKNIKRDEQANLIINELRILAIEFERYEGRWDILKNSANRLVDQINDVNITTNKISKRFNEINSGDFDDTE